MILAHDFSGLAPMMRGGTANDLRGHYLGGETDSCRLMTGATIDAEFRIESAGSLLVILSYLPKLESSVGTVASPERWRESRPRWPGGVSVNASFHCKKRDSMNRLTILAPIALLLVAW